MRPFYFVLGAVVLTLTASAYVVPRSTVKESVILPRGWTKHSSPSPDHVISIHIGLPQPNFSSLEEHLYQVSDPSNSRYGQHLSKEEVEELVAPHPSSLDAVNEWLATHGLEEEDLVRSPAKDWITMRIPVSLVETILETKYYVYKHEASGEYLVRTTSYSLPEDLHEHIDIIQPTTVFGRFNRERSTLVWLDDDSQEPDAQGQITDARTGQTVDASCNTTITINCLLEIYNAVGYTPSKDVNNSIGITGYLGYNANFLDLQSFYADQRPDALGSSFNVVLINNGSNSQDPSQAGDEANLDTQFAFGLSYPVPGTFFSTGGSPPFKPDLITPNDTNEPYLDWLNFVLAQEQVPLVISTSYSDGEQTVPESYARRACQGFAQLGARGVSLIFSSGDAGVGDGELDPAKQICYTNDGRNVTRFMPSFPASCPYVTTVGGTQNFPEVAVSRFYSGAGFSDYFTRPAYQETAVSAYLASLPSDLYKGLYNPQGRAYPDVSAQGDFFRIFLAAKPTKAGGTSAAAPAFAGIVALLNDVRLKAGKTPLGFLNPLFYSTLAEDFNDITVGHSGGCGTWGFNATTGWDAVTGLGTPNFGKFKEKIYSYSPAPPFSGTNDFSSFLKPHSASDFLQFFLLLPYLYFPGIPDIAAQGDYFRIWLSGRSRRIGGTSASSTFAGIVTLLNDARLRAGKPSLGFLNPPLYHKLDDITIGHNAGCGTPGFNATTGWDPEYTCSSGVPSAKTDTESVGAILRYYFDRIQNFQSLGSC